MCGITACVGGGDSVPDLLASLENLEYRGYDSAGVAIHNGNGIEVFKRRGEVSELEAEIDAGRHRGTVGIGHTRWSTHGEPTDENAHPHTDCTGRVAVVHNGIIENHDDLRAALTERGHEFTSDTDTEVVPHLVEEHLAAGHSPEAAFRRAAADLDGNFALAMLVGGTHTVYATRSGSPLVLGVGEDAHYLASDVPAFLEFTDRVVYLEDDDVAVITPDGYRITDADGGAVDRSVETVDWAPGEAEKGGYDHYMLKEIHEQPTALGQAIRGRVTRDGGVDLEGFPAGAFADVSRVQLVGCGTSYHAALYGIRLFADRGVGATAHLASEYVTSPPPVDGDTLLIGVTQSGETADTLEALRRGRDLGARTLALTNVVGSTAARECDDALFIRAGPEIGVAATKTFSSQVAVLVLLAERVARDLTGEPGPDHEDVLAALAALPEQVRTVLDESTASAVAAEHCDQDAYFFIGRDTGYPVALEGALKFKEITYEHAEGFAGGELKHGPLALVTGKTPVFAVFTGRNDGKLLSNVREVQTRDAPVVAIAPDSAEDATRVADGTLTVPATHPELAPVLANVQLQLVSYHAANRLGRRIDKPRNLAKSVTVE